MTAMSVEAAEIKAAGGWRRGPRTVLQVLGLEQSELKLVRLLGWLLRPEGHHGLGNAVVAALLRHLDVPYSPSDEVVVSLEETRFDPTDGAATRADLVLRAGQRCVLVEAKVWAHEQPEQCDRLARLWRREAPSLVFLTPDGARPDSSRCAGDSWTPIRWEDVARIITDAVASNDHRPEPASVSGVHDYVNTLRLFQSERSTGGMTTDQAASFYVRHWKTINEWTRLRADVLATIDAILRDGFTETGRVDAVGAQQGMDPTTSPSYPTFELYRPRWDNLVAVVLQWQPQPKSESPWPYVGVRTGPGANRIQQASLRDALEPYLGKLGWIEHQLGDPFVGWKYIEPADGDLSRLAELCRTELERGWRELVDPIDSFLGGGSDEAAR